MSETPFEAQRRKLHELRDKQDAGQAPAPATKKKAKKKTSG